MQQVTKEFTGPELIDAAQRIARTCRHRIPVSVTEAVLPVQERVMKALRAYERLLQAVLDQHKYRDEDGVEIPVIGYRDAKGRFAPDSPVEPPIHLNPDYRGHYRQGRRYEAGQIAIHNGLVYQALSGGKLSVPGEGEDWLRLEKIAGEERMPFVASENVPIRGALDYHRKVRIIEARKWEIRIRTFPLSALKMTDDDGEELNLIPPEDLWPPMIEGFYDEESEEEYDVEAMLAELEPEGGDGVPPEADVEVRPNG